MKSSFSSFLFPVLAFCSLVSSVPLTKRDVFVPPILYPHAGTVWKMGNHHNVTWETDDAPVNITNKYGMVVLANNGIQDYEHPLASGFNILDGRVVIQVPTNITAGDQYQIVLFGDSGNYSPKFTIVAD